MFLHLLAPDSKFVPKIERLFETAAPGEHMWAVFGQPEQDLGPSGQLRYVTQRGDVREILEETGPLGGVVLNGLPFHVAGRLLRDLPGHTAVAWYVWGFEAYEQWNRLRADLLLPQTAGLLKTIGGRHRRTRRAAHAMRQRLESEKRHGRRLVDRIDFCVSPIQEEYALYRQAGLPAGTGYHEGLVGTLGDYVETGADALESRPGADVQVGNSASPWNNHLDALSLLAASPRTGVVVPLGYADELYASALVERGEELLGDRFRALRGFLPLEEYLQVVGSCGHVIMNHRRQQALGTIFAALWRGASVHMNTTTAYRGLGRMGFDVRLVPQASPFRAEPLPADTVVRHRRLLDERFGEERVVPETRRLLRKMADMSATRRGSRRRQGGR
jgi:hypothetical protein